MSEGFVFGWFPFFFQYKTRVCVRSSRWGPKKTTPFSSLSIGPTRDRRRDPFLSLSIGRWRLGPLTSLSHHTFYELRNESNEESSLLSNKKRKWAKNATLKPRERFTITAAWLVVHNNKTKHARPWIALIGSVWDPVDDVGLLINANRFRNWPWVWFMGRRWIRRIIKRAYNVEIKTNN